MRRTTTTIALLALAGSLLTAPSPANAQWSALGLSGLQVNKLRAHGGYLFACTSNGIHKLSFTDPDTFWIPAGFAGQNVMDLASLGPQTMLAARALTGAPDDTVSLFRSIDGGASWQPFQNGFGAGTGGSGRQARRLLSIASSPGTVFATSGRIEKSVDGGQSWRVVVQAWVLNAIEQAPADPQLVWAGGETTIFSPYVLKSTDGGETWKQFSLFAGGDNAVDAIAGHPTDPNTVYLGMEGRVMKTEDGGTTWYTMTSPNPSMYTFGMAIRPSLPLKIYAAGSSFIPDPRGVVFHQSLDGALSWRAMSFQAEAGLGVNHLLLRADGVEETLYVATGNGVYRHAQIPTGVSVSDGSSKLALRCRPNPFLKGTAVEFTLSQAQRVSLRIVDVRGRVVANLLEKELGAGDHRVSWNGQAAGAGIYFCRLQAGGCERWLKILHLR